ncbi:MAG: DUF1947 domain-containing protein [Candidatus Hodarchaeota archaeon]
MTTLSEMPRIERIKKRHLLKKRDKKEHLAKIEVDIGSQIIGLEEKAQLEAGVLDDGQRVLLLDGDILFFEQEGRMFPSLHAVLNGLVTIPFVTVDMGAVRFVVNGADIMRPGITKVDDDVKEDSIVAIVDERHRKPLAIGVAMLGAEDILSASSGKVILSKHHVNDALWNFSKG